MKYFLNTIGRKFLWCFLTLFVLLSQIPSGYAQNKDSKGKDFWLMFNGNLGTPVLTLFITSSVNTTGNVSVPGLAFSQNFSVTANTVTSVVVPNSAATHTSDVKDNKGIHVTSNDEVTVYGLNYIAFTTDAYLGLPTDALGTDYIVLSYKNSLVLGTQLGIVATVDNTVVTINPSVTTGARVAGTPYNITLNKGDVYELRNSTGSVADLSGTTISATQPIGVFGSTQCGNVPGGQVYCDHMCEMLPPTTSWGKKFGTVPLKSRINGDTWRIIASENSTTVKIDGIAQPAINRAQFVEKIITGQSVIESDKPVMVCQYSNGSGFSGNPGDPFMMIIPPLEQFLAKYTVTTVTGYVAHYINVVAPTSIAGTLTLDGAAVPAASFAAIGTTGFSGAQIQVQPGTHNLAGTLPFGVFMYGFNNDDSYGYPGGQSFSEVATVNSLVVAPKNGSGAVGTSTCFTGTVKDQFNNPVNDIRVDFNITGPNAGKSGFAITDALGVAQFCYTGNNPGNDNISAVVGSLSDNASFIWTDNACNLTANAAILQAISNNGNDGKVQLTASGGTPPYTFTFNGNSNSTGLFENLSAGTYNYTVKDDKDCSANGTITLTPPRVVNNKKCPKDTIIVADPATCLAKVMWDVPNNPYPDTVIVKPDPFTNNTMLLKGVYNGHGYYLSTGYYDWYSADKAAWLSCSHLVTITSQGESDFIFDKFPTQDYGPWIGLYNTGTEGSFAWVTGEPLVYTNWSTNEPNNQGGTPSNIYEGSAHLWGYDPQNRWNDLNGWINYLQFIAEADKPILTYKQIKGPELGSVQKPGRYEVCYEISNCTNSVKDTCCFIVEVVCKKSKLLTPCDGSDTTIIANPLTCKATLKWDVPVDTYLPSIDVENGFNGNAKIELGGVYNGHGYYQSTDVYYWQQAKTAASGVGAHLVTITTPGESGFIYDYFRQGNVYGPWIGLYNTGTEGSFAWVNGEPFVYSNWEPNEPNNLHGSQNFIYEPYVHIMGWDPENRWNDLNDWQALNFIAEFDSPNITYRQIEGPAYGTEVDPGTYKICYEITNKITGKVDTCCFTIIVVCNNNEVPSIVENKPVVPNNMGSRNISSPIQETVIAKEFKAVASPNPSPNSFRIRIESNNLTEKISVQVVDVMGRMVEMKDNLKANSTLIIGDRYMPGVYITQIVQGNKKVMIKLIKQ